LNDCIMPGEDVFITPLDRTKPSLLYTLNENILR
jgi:hypothetical protein